MKCTKTFAKSPYSPAILDAQAPVKIDRYVVLDSPEWRKTDDDPKTTKALLRFGLQSDSLMVDVNGRVWSQEFRGKCCPIHFECGNELIGIRLSQQAAN